MAKMCPFTTLHPVHCGYIRRSNVPRLRKGCLRLFADSILGGSHTQCHSALPTCPGDTCPACLASRRHLYHRRCISSLEVPHLLPLVRYLSGTINFSYLLPHCNDSSFPRSAQPRACCITKWRRGSFGAVLSRPCSTVPGLLQHQRLCTGYNLS